LFFFGWQLVVIVWTLCVCVCVCVCWISWISTVVSFMPSLPCCSVHSDVCPHFYSVPATHQACAHRLYVRRGAYGGEQKVKSSAWGCCCISPAYPLPPAVQLYVSCLQMAVYGLVMHQVCAQRFFARHDAYVDGNNCFWFLGRRIVDCGE
jgi:hypothetical protein